MTEGKSGKSSKLSKRVSSLFMPSTNSDPNTAQPTHDSLDTPQSTRPRSSSRGESPGHSASAQYFNANSPYLSAAPVHHFQNDSHLLSPISPAVYTPQSLNGSSPGDSRGGTPVGSPHLGPVDGSTTPLDEGHAKLKRRSWVPKFRQLSTDMGTSTFGHQGSGYWVTNWEGERANYDISRLENGLPVSGLQPASEIKIYFRTLG
jgi:hypothetical protein